MFLDRSSLSNFSVVMAVGGLLIGLWLATSSQVRAADGFSAYAASSQRLLDAISAADDTGAIAVLSKPAIEHLVPLVSAQTLTAARQASDAGDMGRLMEVCGRTNQAVMSLLLFGMKRHARANLAPSEIRKIMTRLMQQNALRFQDKLTYLQPALLRCNAMELPLMSKFITHLKPPQLTPTRAAGLHQMRQGLSASFVGTFITASNGKLGDSYRGALFQALSDTAASFVSTMPIVNRRIILRILANYTGRIPKRFHAQVEHIHTVLLDKRCVDLCKF